MDVHLARIGADGVYKRAMTEEQWKRMESQVQTWQDESLEQALISFGIVSAPAAGTLDSQRHHRLSDLQAILPSSLQRIFSDTKNLAEIR
jgi:hypothetical protein